MLILGKDWLERILRLRNSGTKKDGNVNSFILLGGVLGKKRQQTKTMENYYMSAAQQAEG